MRTRCTGVLALWLVLVVGLPRAQAGNLDGSALSVAGRALQRAFAAGVDSARGTSFCLDLFVSARVPHTDVCVGGAVKLSQPSAKELATARDEGRKLRRLYLSGGVSNSLVFAGYNPLFGGFNASYSAPVGLGLGAGLFAGGPYTGFFVDTPTPLSLGGWVQDRGPPAKGQAPPDPFAAVTLTVPGLSHLGVAVGARLWIFSPALAPLVRPLKRPAWWLHRQRTKVCRYLGRKLGPTARRIAGPVKRTARCLSRGLRRAARSCHRVWAGKPRPGVQRPRAAWATRSRRH